MIMIEYFIEITNINIDELLRFFKTFIPKRDISIFKICKNVFITHERDSKLLTMYNFYYSNHRS